MALGTEATRNSSAWPSRSLTKPGPVQDGIPPGVTRRATTSGTWEAMRLGVWAQARHCLFCHSLSPNPSSLVEALPEADTLPTPGTTHNPVSPAIVSPMPCPSTVPPYLPPSFLSLPS